FLGPGVLETGQLGGENLRHVPPDHPPDVDADLVLLRTSCAHERAPPPGRAAARDGHRPRKPPDVINAPRSPPPRAGKHFVRSTKPEARNSKEAPSGRKPPRPWAGNRGSKPIRCTLSSFGFRASDFPPEAGYSL